MSESSSIFVKMHIKPAEFEAFLQAKPQALSLNSNLTLWWDSREMASKSPLTQEDLRTYPFASNAEIIAIFTNQNIDEEDEDEENMMAFSDYDATQEIWHFGAILYSENYGDMLKGIAFLHSAAAYKTTNDEDFGIIYDYFWGGGDLAGVAMLMQFDAKTPVLDATIQTKQDLKPEILAYADNYLTEKFNYFQAQFALGLE